jgi:hypothetical protein
MILGARQASTGNLQAWGTVFKVKALNEREMQMQAAKQAPFSKGVFGLMC